jgi:hypothetical protein
MVQLQNSRWPIRTNFAVPLDAICRWLRGRDAKGIPYDARVSGLLLQCR